MTSHHFDELRLPPEFLAARRDRPWEQEERGQEHRVRVLQAVRDAVRDVLVARYLHQREYGTYADDDPEFVTQFWDPIWDGLRDSLTRQDLLRWLVDWAHQAVQDEAMEIVTRIQDDMDALDDGPDLSGLMQNPG